MARDFVTSSRSTCGETLVLCQNKTRSNGLVKTSARANRHPHKPANLSAKKSNTSAKANMAPVRRSRPLPLACRRRGGPAWNCLQRGAAGNEHKDKHGAIWPRADAARNGPRLRVRARAHARYAGKAAPPQPAGACRITPKRSHAGVDLLRARAPPKKPPEGEREDASYTVRSPERNSANFAARSGALMTPPATARAPVQFPLAKRPSSSLLHPSQRVFN